jgi:hypothetical protein
MADVQVNVVFTRQIVGLVKGLIGCLVESYGRQDWTVELEHKRAS